MSLLDSIKAKVQSLQAQLEEHMTMFKQKEEQIAQLVTDKNTVTALVHQIRGAISMAESVKADVEAGVADVATIVADVKEGNGIGAVEDGVKAVSDVTADVSAVASTAATITGASA